MTIVRHALARDKKSWPGPDLERPLDPVGERQAAGMARSLMKHKVRRIISSPAIRCVHTMQPLAEAANVPIELWDELGRDADATQILAAFSDPEFHHAVLCTHGEVLHQLLLVDNVRRIARRGRLPRAAS
jgi:phosphohistidine phosphatase SixA